jgi:hypothetical protein
MTRRRSSQGRNTTQSAAADIELRQRYENYQREIVPLALREFLDEARRDFEGIELEEIENLRRLVGVDAEATPRIRQEQQIKKVLKKAKHKSLKSIKECVEMARKPKMRTVEQYLCDRCDKIIPKDDGKTPQGFVVQGNIYTADPSIRGGLIGNNIPEPKEGEVLEGQFTITPSQIRETVLCKDCFLKAVGILSDNPYESPAKGKKFRGVLPRGDVPSDMLAQISGAVGGRREQSRWTDQMGQAPHGYESQVHDDMEMADEAEDMEMVAADGPRVSMESSHATPQEAQQQARQLREGYRYRPARQSNRTQMDMTGLAAREAMAGMMGAPPPGADPGTSHPHYGDTNFNQMEGGVA